MFNENLIYNVIDKLKFIQIYTLLFSYQLQDFNKILVSDDLKSPKFLLIIYT